MYGYICMYNGHKVEVYTDKGRSFSEVETTKNELQFLAEHYPKWYKLIKL